jgi:hypothetical protein
MYTSALPDKEYIMKREKSNQTETISFAMFVFYRKSNKKWIEYFFSFSTYLSALCIRDENDPMYALYIAIL